jgi:hypothetical protein
MERHLSLIKTDYKEMEKRIFPRFPFGLMMFRESSQDKKVFAVKDISLTGMQISLKDGELAYKLGDKIIGNLQWRESDLVINGIVQWVRGQSIGVSFETGIAFESKMSNFLSFENIVSHIKPLHQSKLPIDLPNNLKYWLKSDGVLEIFVWEHSQSGISRFQIILMEHFIEWEEGSGIRTGRVMTQRDLDTPLSLEDEFVFQIDDGLVQDKVDLAIGIVRKIKEEHLPSSARDFLFYKLGG